MSNDIVLPQRQQVELQMTEGTTMSITRTKFRALTQYLAENCPTNQLGRAIERLMRMKVVDDE